MKKTIPILLKITFLTFFLFQFTLSFSQNEKEVNEIISHYDLKKLKELEVKYLRKAEIEKEKAYAAAKANNWPIFRKADDGSVEELMKLTSDGYPIYYSTNNINAAKSTRADILQANYNLKGQGMTARIWDGGKVRASHQEFGNRVTVVDATAGPDGNNFHATHVTGTVIASGVVPNAKGMAPMANARTFNWNNDMAEVLSEVQLGMLLSNHSYGTPSTSVPSWYIGSYTDDARDWDDICYNSPYYLMVLSAGNNGGDNNSSAITPGYDKLTGNKVAKNNLVVANAQDANISSSGALIGVSINSGSSQGPADDLRIKPDITGNGTGLYSTFESSDTDYGSISGTSMASPNVMGTLLLLQQYYNQTNQHFMRASTLKALACHTADDAGNPGPDAVFGWGLLNGGKAATTILQNGLNSLITEETLQQGQSYSITVDAIGGTTPLQATIAWTDVPGQAINGVVNPTTPALVNDLDIRITKGASTYYPWKLRSNATMNAVNDADNNVDNVERVDVTNPSGTYVITVTHKGTLQQGPQNFSLVVTGIDSDFALTQTSPNEIVCNNQTAQYTFSYVTNSFSETTFSAVGLPAGVTATFNPPSAIFSDNIVMTLSNLQNVPPGDYVIGFKGTNASETETDNVSLKIYNSTFANLTLTEPTNNKEGLATTLNMAWQPNINAESYRLQVSTDINFGNLVVNQVTAQTEYTVSNLVQATRYYWRVLPINRCAEATTNTVFRFDTGNQTCNAVFSATDFSNATISTSANALASVPVTVTGGMTVGSLQAQINIAHTYIEDFSVYLEGPAAIGSPMITIFEEPCGDNDNIIATISDAGVAYICGTNPGISGTVLPKEPLSTFNNLPADGVWTLYVFDSYNGDGGSINGFSLNFCNVVSANMSIGEELIAKIAAYPNPNKGILNVQLPDNAMNTTLSLYDIQGRKVATKTAASNAETMYIGNLQDGVYVLSIENENFRTSKKIVLNK